MPQPRLLSFGQPDGSICQLAFLVKDIRSAMISYTRAFGAGPWYLMEGAGITDARYRGRPGTFKGNVACGNVGHMMLELIEQTNNEPSIFMEALHARGYGLHHHGVVARDFEVSVTTYRSRGYEIAFECMTGMGSRVAFFDTRGEFPYFIEVMECNDLLERVFLGLSLASLQWDGQDPIRTFTSFDDLAAVAQCAAR